MNLSEFIKNFDSKITDGSEYGWNCYGYDARYLDFESKYAHASIIYNCKNQTVYQANISCKEDGDDNLPNPYQWFNPEYRENFMKECTSRGTDPHHAWDDVYYIELETVEDFLEKSHAIFNNLPFDRRISVPLEVDDDVILHLALEAHKRDITMNKMVEILLQNAIDSQTHS